MVKESQHPIDNRRSLSRKNPVVSAGVERMDNRTQTREELYSGSRELEKERRALDGENLRRGLKKETWSEIGVESKERR
ncbi:hypothetical protein TNCV_777621 [Trichonephila clavipes]|nr:hypothetical protein TNCV_777621 [Trichonephila clavipes]